MKANISESRMSIVNRWITNETSFYGIAFLLILTGLCVEVYLNADPNRLDWIDWWFWARQNLLQLTDSGGVFGIVMSPVQGLFGQNCPVSPFFHPLWALAARVSDPVLAHGISSVLAFALYSVTVWLVASKFIQHKLLVLAATLVCLNLFFDIVPVTEIYPLPKSNFDYFQIVPPHTFSFLLAIAVFLVSVTVKPCLWKVVANLGCLSIAVLADPLHPMVFFPPVVAVIGIYYVLNLREYAREILFTLLGAALLFLVGVFEYPLLLKETIGRSVFNEYLFHHTKRHDNATFAFQNKQNLVFIALMSFLLAWHAIAKRDKLSMSVFAVQIIFLAIGFVYLSTDLNLDFLPNTMILESNVIPLYIVFAVRALEQSFEQYRQKILTPVLWVTFVGMGLFLFGKVMSIDLEPKEKKDSFSQQKLLSDRPTNDQIFPGSTTFLLGTRGSQYSELNGLDGPFSMKHVIFAQNNEHSSQFLGKYGRSAALVSYWLNGIPTLEENSIVTNPFYLYFFRNLFTRDDDYYMTNLNFFTVPQMHLYALLGVRDLISDFPTHGSDQFVLEDTTFFKKTFPDYNYGQYAPGTPINVGSAREAVRVMGDPLFDPIREYVVLEGDLSQDKPLGKSTGQINFQKNGIRFVGESNGTTLHVLPVLFSNCLVSENGNQLVRVNLLLTGIIFDGEISDRISYDGPPFHNDWLKDDIKDVKRFNLRDRSYAYPPDADKANLEGFLRSPWH